MAKDMTATDEATTPDATPDAAPEATPPADPPAADPPADPPADAPAPDATPPAEGDDAAEPDAGGQSLSASVSGNLITLSGTGFEAGKRYDVRFQRPDGSIDNTLAVAQEDGSLTTYATLKATGKHTAWLELLGAKVAQLKFKV